MRVIYIFCSLFFFGSFMVFAQDCVQDISAYFYQISAHLDDKTIYSWGKNENGEIGNNTTDSIPTPIEIEFPGPVKQINHGLMFSLVLLEDGTIWSWGKNLNGQLGNGTTEDTLIPAQIGEDNDWGAVSAGERHSLALKSDGTLWGWGNNGAYELNGGAENTYLFPHQIDEDNDWEKIYAGSYRSLAIKTDGSLWGCGRNLNGAVGIAGGQVVNFQRIGSPEDSWLTVSADGSHTLAIKDDHTLWGWGDNSKKQLNLNNVEKQETPVQISSDTWKAISASNKRLSAGIKTDGSIWHWGTYEIVIPIGEVTIGLMTEVEVDTENKFEKIAAGTSTVFAIDEQNNLWLWGSNRYGDLGNGTYEPNMEPHRLVFCEDMGFSKKAELMDVDIYPNPAQDYFYVEENHTDIEHYSIYNLQGKVIRTKKYTNAKIEIEDLAAGLYFLKLSNGNLHEILKFIKE